MKALLAVGGLGALGLAFAAVRSKARRGRSPWLRIEEGGDAPHPEEPAILWLALATLSPAQRASLLDEVEAAMASVEARANPLLVDLVEDDVVDVFHRNQGWLLPLCTAASALLAVSYEGPDGFRVRALAPDSARKPGDVAAWKSGDEDRRERRARFLAWPASRSLVVRARSKDGARALEADLRNACSRKESAISLVLDRPLLEGRSPEPRLDTVLGRLAKAQERFQTDEDLQLVPKVPTPGVAISPWVILDDSEFLVVPKLGALSPSDRFASEIRERLRGTDAEITGAG